MSPPREQTAERRPAVVLGMSANGLAVARSLGRRGIPVVGIGASPAEPGLRSRYLSAKHIAPDVQDQGEFLDFLVSLGKGLNDLGVLILTADEYVLFCSEYREDLAAYYAFNLPSQETIKCFLDKEETYKFARRFDIPHPRTAVVTDEQTVKELASDMEYPCIFKPRDSHLWRRDYRQQKVVVIDSPADLLHAYRGLGHHASKVILQEIIPGPDDNIYQYLAYCNKESEIIAEFCCRKLRQYPPHFGIACLCESRYEHRVVEQGRFLLSKIQAKGIFAIEYKFDERNGLPAFLEANLRTSFFGELPTAAGVDFPHIIYRNLVDEYDTRQGTGFREGIRLWNLELDFGCYVRQRRMRETTFLKWLNRLKAKEIAHTYLARDDPWPWGFVYGRLMVKVMKRVFRRMVGIRRTEDE